LNKTLIGLFVNTAELGKYDMAYRLITMALIMITSLGSVMTPRISTIYIQGDFLRIKGYLKMSLQFTLLFSFLVIPLLIGISNNLVHWFLGSQFSGAELYLILLSPMILLNSLSNLLANQFMIPSGNEKKYLFSLIVGCLMGILSSIILIPKFMVIGACLSVLIGESTILLSHIYQVKNIVMLHNIIGKGWQFIVACLPIILCSLIFKKMIWNTIFMTTIQIIISFLIYFGVLLMFKNEFLISAISRFRVLFKYRVNI